MRSRRDVVAGDHRAQIERHHLRPAHHVEDRVPHVLAQFAALDQLDAGRGEAFGEDVLRVGREAAGIHRADVGHVHEARAPGDQLAVVVDRRDEIDVGRVQRRRVGIVEQEDVAFVDAALEPADDRLAGLGGAGEVMQEADAAHQQRAVGLIERDHQVVALVGDRAAGHMLERDHRLLDDAEQPMADDREGDRIMLMAWPCVL